MQTAKQLSVSLVNKPGRLADVLVALNKGKVSFRALAVMDTGQRGSIRFVPDNYEAAKKILEKINVGHEAAEVLLVEISGQSGGFRKVCERLAAEHLTIDYAYCSYDHGGKTKGGGLAVIKVNDRTKAKRVLGSNGATRKKMPYRRVLLTR
ncbi:MAG: hypothetical protein KKE86_06640 [Planctomycetes bacterium]|nr:hypothetical protein [Planctomycetota bacterium]MBU4399000.1 hypothetical protein [Planctomycetota bacterium]MCG2682151.1 hypothetical protein [Planctomycetales bacterium]